MYPIDKQASKHAAFDQQGLINLAFACTSSDRKKVVYKTFTQGCANFQLVHPDFLSMADSLDLKISTGGNIRIVLCNKDSFTQLLAHANKRRDQNLKIIKEDHQILEILSCQIFVISG